MKANKGTSYTWVKLTPEEAIAKLRHELNQTSKYRLFKRRSLKAKIRMWEKPHSTGGVE